MENKFKPTVSVWIPFGYMRDLMDYGQETFTERCNIDYRFIFLEPPSQELRDWVRKKYVRPWTESSKDSVRFHVSTVVEIQMPWENFEQLRNNCFSAIIEDEDN